jgi:hypothetical protein
MSEDIIRVLRVIEYVGPRSVVETHLRDVIHGVKKTSDGMEIRTATVGVVPDIIEMGRVEQLLPPVTQKAMAQPLPEVTGTLCSICNEPQMETNSGITCSNGHGGAEPLKHKHILRNQ